MKEKVKNNEESRVYFIKCHLEKYSQIIEELNHGSLEFSAVELC